MTTRREFVQTSAAVLAAACARGAASRGASGLVASATPESRLPLGFSTLGTPGWDLNRVVTFAAANGYSAIELRGVVNEMDLSKVPEFATDRLASTKALIA